MRLLHRTLSLSALNLLLAALSVIAGRGLPAGAQLAYTAQTADTSGLVTVLLDSGRALTYDLSWPTSTAPVAWLDRDRLLLTSGPFQYLVFIVGQGLRSIEEPRTCASILAWNAHQTACTWVGGDLLMYETDCLLRGCSDEPRKVEADLSVYTLVWSPQGDRLAVVEWSSAGFALYRLAVDDGRLERLLPRGSAFPWSVTWSPDGELLAICERETDTVRLRIISADDGHSRLPSRALSGSSECIPAWSPDSQHVLFTETASGGGGRVLDLSVETGAVRTLYASTRDLLLPQWSPDDDAILYYERDGQRLALRMLALNGGAVRFVSGDRRALFGRPVIWRPIQP